MSDNEYFQKLSALVKGNVDKFLKRFENEKLIYKFMHRFEPITKDYLNEILKEEIQAFYNFLQNNDVMIASERGKKASSQGYNKDFIWTFFSIFHTSLLEINQEKIYEFAQFIQSIIYIYIRFYDSSYTQAENLKRNIMQEQLHNALHGKIIKQQEKIIQNEKEQNRQRTAFLINLAHETKLPLTIIRNQINMIIEEAGKRQLKTVPPLEEQIKGLQVMVGNILDYEKILQGKMLHNHNKIINISKAITKKIKLFELITVKKHLSIESVIQKDLHIQIAPLALDQILNNIIDNAIKYNQEKGNIHITVKADDNSVYFIVQDTGIGIPADELKHIFKPYYQSTHKKRSNQGIGAGLSLVKNILEEVSGNITVESTLNKGTTVTIIFKRVIITEETKDEVVEDIKISKPILRSIVTLKPEVYDENRKTILFVEDNTELLSYLQKSMLNEFNFFYAVNGKDALQKLEIMPRPDVIISDIMMDVMDGFEFLDIVRENRNMQDIPFIFLTAKVTQEDKLNGLKKGAVDYIEKPFSIKILKEKLNSLIRDHEAYIEKEKEKMENRLLKTIRSKEGTQIKYERFYTKYNLTDRERDIALYIIKGFELKEIAEKLYISYDTVKTHFNHIKEKCKVKNRVELANLFHE